MGADAPAAVAAALDGIDVANPNVAGDVVDAALAMPAAMGSTLVPTIARAAQAGSLAFHTIEAGDLATRLAEGGEIEAALSLAEGLFEPNSLDSSGEWRGRDFYWYEKALDHVLPILARSRPIPFLHALCRWLTTAIEAKPNVDRESGDDYSYWWRQSIEEHGQNSDSDFAGNLVGFVRRGFEVAIAEGGVSLSDALRIIEHRRFLVFHRLKVHLVDFFAAQDPKMATGIMMDRGYFDDFRFKHEYAILMGHQFDLLPGNQQERWLGWARSGPDPEELDDLGEDAQTARADYWRFTRLHWVREHLTGRDLEFYQGMLETHGEPELADLHMRVSSGSWGSISPVKLEEWQDMPFEDVVTFIRSWRPIERSRLGPDIKGLADTFESYVSLAPEAFARQADLLVGCEAIYVRGFLKQITAAVKAGESIELGAVLSLASWALDRPLKESTVDGGEGDPLVDKDWQWTRDQVSDLIKAICQARVDDRPKYGLEGLRGALWSILSGLYSDPAPSYISSGRDTEDPRQRDYLTPAINSPRGKAVEACVEYARWVASQLKEVVGDETVVPGGLESMPEVGEMLEWQIETENRSPEALAIIGLHVGLLFWIDRAWLAASAPKLFDLGQGMESPAGASGWAAWNTFLIWVKPHIEFYRLFHDQFEYAVEQSATVQAQDASREGAMEHLGEHLMVLYARGQLSLEVGSTLRVFLDGTNPVFRRYAIGFAGRILWREAGLPKEMIGRLLAFWEYYWSGPGAEDSRERPDAWLFGPWFASQQLPPKWALQQLSRYVEVVALPEPDHAVVDRLAEIASADLEAAVTVLDRMIHGDREGWRIHSWRQSAGKVLRQALTAGGRPQSLAEATLDFLGRRGFPDFLVGSADGPAEQINDT
jgi:hypothetical protein